MGGTQTTFQTDRFSALVGKFYDAAGDDRLWSGMANEVARCFHSTSTVIKLHSAQSGVQLLESTENLVLPKRLHDWADHWHASDLWVERSVAFGLSQVVTDHDLVTPAEQRKSGFYREWLHQLDIHHMIGAVFPVGDTIGVLGIHRPASAGSFDAADRQTVAQILPHLQRSLQLGQRLAAATLTSNASLAAFDRLETGVLVVDRACKIIHANALAEKSLLSGDITISGGQIRLARPALQERLAASVRSAIETASGRRASPAPALAIPRDGRAPLTLVVAPFTARAAQFASLPPMALIFLRDPEILSISTQRLRSLFGLTRTEAVIAAELGHGRALDDIAKRQGVGLATVRSHLKRILAKTGTNRQAEVVALIGRTVAVLPDTIS